MKGYNDYSIGDVFTLNNEELQIFDYIIRKLHDKQNDRRTKKVDTVIWCLRGASGEYRKTSEGITEALSEGRMKLVRRSV